MATGPSLPQLPSVTKISQYVTRILGQNPGKFTLQGTNTYLIHHPSSPSLILLDTAQSFPSYLPHLRSSIQSHPIQPCEITDIILSHYHHDHTEGTRAVLEELGRMGCVRDGGVRVWKFRCDEGGKREEEGKDLGIEEGLKGIEERLVDTKEIQEGLIEGGGGGGGKIRALKDGQKFTIRDPGAAKKDSSCDSEADLSLEIVHTPGHTTDSISILLHGPSSNSSSSSSKPLGLFSFDTVLGHGTAVFSSLSTYLSSLTSLINQLPPSPSSSEPSNEEKAKRIPIYPGHGEVIEDGVSKLKEYRKHRLDREEQVVEALKGILSGGRGIEEGTTASSLTQKIYGSSIPSSLIPAATRGILLHLEKLVLDGTVSRQDPSPGGQGGDRLDWEGMGIKEKDIPKGWNDEWKWVGSDGEREAGREEN